MSDQTIALINQAESPVSPLLKGTLITDGLVVPIEGLLAARPSKFIPRPAKELFQSTELSWICMDHIHQKLQHFSPLEQFMTEFNLTEPPQVARVDQPLLMLNDKPFGRVLYFGLPNELMRLFRGWLNSTAVTDNGAEKGRIRCGMVGEPASGSPSGSKHFVYFAFYVQSGMSLVQNGFVKYDGRPIPDVKLIKTEKE